METGSILAAIPLPFLKYQISVVPTPLIPSVLMGFIVGTVATVAQAWGHLHWYKGSVADSALNVLLKPGTLNSWIFAAVRYLDNSPHTV